MEGGEGRLPSLLYVALSVKSTRYVLIVAVGEEQSHRFFPEPSDDQLRSGNIPGKLSPHLNPRARLIFQLGVASSVLAEMGQSSGESPNSIRRTRLTFQTAFASISASSIGPSRKSPHTFTDPTRL